MNCIIDKDRYEYYDKVIVKMLEKTIEWLEIDFVSSRKAS